MAALSELFDAPKASQAPEPAPQAPESAPVAPQTHEPTVDDDDGDDGSESAPSDVQQSQSRPEKQVPLGALQAERKKRQELDRRVIELQAKMQAQEEMRLQLQQGKQQQDPYAYEPDDVYANLPDVLKKVESKFQTALEQQARKLKFEASEAIARERYEDYEDVISQYADVVQKVPGLAYEIEQSTSPVVAAYKGIKSYLERQQFGDKQSIEAYISAEVEKRLSEKMAGQGQANAAQVPTSLAGVRGSPNKAAREQPFERTPLSALFAKRK